MQLWREFEVWHDDLRSSVDSSSRYFIETDGQRANLSPSFWIRVAPIAHWRGLSILNLQFFSLSLPQCLLVDIARDGDVPQGDSMRFEERDLIR